MLHNLLVCTVANSQKFAKATVRNLKLVSDRYLPEAQSRVSALRRSLERRPTHSVLALAGLLVLSLGLWGQIPGAAMLPRAEPQAVVSTESVGPTPAATATGRTETGQPSSRGPRPEAKDKPQNYQDAFIQSAVEPAQASQRETKVPASVTIAQAILESDWGRSGLSTKANNFFGIKARPDPGPAGSVYMNTLEFMGGGYVNMSEPFRAYHKMEESFIDHGLFLSGGQRYAPAFKFTNNPKQFAIEIHRAGYATDPGYSSKLIGLMDKYNLYDYDLK